MKQENYKCASEVKPASKENGKSSKEAMNGVRKAVLGNRSNCGIDSKVEKEMDLIYGMQDLNNN